MADHSGENRIRLMGMHMVMVPPDDDPGFFQKLLFLFVNLIGEPPFPIRKIRRLIGNRLVGHNQIAAQRSSLADDLNGWNQRRNDAGTRLVRIAAFVLVAAGISLQMGMIGEDLVNDFRNLHNERSLSDEFFHLVLFQDLPEAKLREHLENISAAAIDVFCHGRRVPADQRGHNIL